MTDATSTPLNYGECITNLLLLVRNSAKQRLSIQAMIDKLKEADARDHVATIEQLNEAIDLLRDAEKAFTEAIHSLVATEAYNCI